MCRLAGVSLTILCALGLSFRPAAAQASVTVEKKLDNLCGPFSLVFCARWLGQAADWGHVLDSCDVTLDTGTSFGSLAAAAGHLGLEGRCYQLELDDLRSVSPMTPAVAHVDGNHFVVVWMQDKHRDEVTVLDPPFRISHMILRDFGRRWDGALLVVSRPGEQPHFAPRFRWERGIAAGATLAALALLGQAVVARRRSRTRSQTR